MYAPDGGIWWGSHTAAECSSASAVQPSRPPLCHQLHHQSLRPLSSLQLAGCVFWRAASETPVCPSAAQGKQLHQHMLAIVRVPVAGVATLTIVAGVATLTTVAGVAALTSVAGVAALTIVAGVAALTIVAGVATLAIVAGIATLTIVAGIAAPTIVAGMAGVETLTFVAGVATLTIVAGVATLTTWGWYSNYHGLGSLV